MSLEICVLGSGSGGNSTVVRTPQGCFLIDAGFGPRVTAQRLRGTGVEMEHLRAIVLTHLDTDHFKTHWFNTMTTHGIRMFCHVGKVGQLLGSPEARDRALRHHDRPLGPWVSGFGGEAGAFEPIEGVRMEPVELAHDEAGSHGFVMACDGHRAGYATDLGHVPARLVERFCGVDVLMLESNYDPEMERTSDRPAFLKRRIMGGKGHLSNEQALAAVRAILDQTLERHGAKRLPRHIVLMHRSRQCNCPKLVERMFGADGRIKGVLTLAHQEERTGWLSLRGERETVTQMAMNFGI